MYCPKCGDELKRADMLCEGCGSDLRRIIRDEYWEEIKAPSAKPAYSDRFDHAGEAAVNQSSWREHHRADDRRLYMIGGGSIALAIVLMIVFIVFSGHGKKPDDPRTSMAPTTVSTTTAQPAPVVAPPPAPLVPINEMDVKNFVETWRKNWEKIAEFKKAADLAALYADDFASKPDGRNKATFVDARGKEAKAANVLFVETGDPSVQINGERATATFSVDYLSDTAGRSGTVTINMERRAGKFLILDENWTDNTPPANVDPEKIKQVVLSWRKSWEELAIKHELGTLPSFYHPEFKSPKGRDVATVLGQKLDLAKKNTLITIEIKDIKVAVLGDRAVAGFRQVFQSMTYSDDGVKILVFKLKDGVPLITWEGFRLNKKLPSLDADNFWGQ